MTQLDANVWNENLINDILKLNNNIYVYDNWLEKYLSYISKAKLPIIDLGCGIGNDTLFLINNNKKVLSVDFSKKGLDFISSNIKNSKTLLMDMSREWNIPENYTDLMIANLSLHYFDSKKTVDIINNIKKTIVKNGILIVRLNSINDINYGAKKGIEIEKHLYKTNIQKRYFDIDDINKFFKNMKIISCNEIKINSDIHKDKFAWEVVMINTKNDDYNIRLEQYNKIITPKELLEFMDKYITYGIYGTDGKSYTNWENDINSEFQVACQTKYALCDKERMLKYGLGTCWDQVELERFWFKEHNYNFKTFFIWFYFEERNDYGTHTYLVYERNNKYYYFEHADYNNKGIYEFNSYKDAIKFQMDKHINFMRQNGLPINDDVLKHIQVIEFNINNYGIDMNEYFENLFKSKIIYENNYFKSMFN